MRLLLAASALLLLTSAPGMAGQKHAAPAATPSGPAVSCIPLSQIRETRVRDDRTIDFMVRGKKAYRNTLPNSCPSLGSERRFLYKTSTSQLCSLDIITVLVGPGTMRGASCGLGPFQPVTFVPR